MIDKIEAAVEKARWAVRDEAQEALDRAYADFSNLAELELEHITGTRIERPGARSRMPSFAWRSVLPEKKTDGRRLNGGGTGMDRRSCT